ncbi:hypothetical protein MIND_00590000 [Mycena indigotica]|uniref:Uncharacterized protein n=1 Tax=Mycena indigotica TaxID=2126181 RepID=A0A8H6SRK2_9AGAR|nr:uncharacterized protein MIND_00590000 [Mycena indigotica]KAF7303607.1 hypothetical protein MIND_00590000 [Mycena indigotica]
MPILPRQSNEPPMDSRFKFQIVTGVIAAAIVMAVGFACIGVFYVWRWHKRRSLAAKEEESETGSTRTSLLRRKSTFFDRGPPPEDEDAEFVLWDSEGNQKSPRRKNRRWQSDDSAAVPLIPSNGHGPSNEHPVGSNPGPQTYSPQRPPRPATQLIDLPSLVRDGPLVPEAPIRAVAALRQPKTGKIDIQAVPSVAVVHGSYDEDEPLNETHLSRYISYYFSRKPTVKPSIKRHKHPTSRPLPLPPSSPNDDLYDVPPSAIPVNRLTRLLSYYLSPAAPSRGKESNLTQGQRRRREAIDAENRLEL